MIFVKFLFAKIRNMQRIHTYFLLKIEMIFQYSKTKNVKC
ncbi:hypothetical protein CCYN49044_20095 [Capnocytophaga cynodegmi]|nr:hypothetical protein CCYN49044_20095 [Capnocytophaga cynodegmi]